GPGARPKGRPTRPGGRTARGHRPRQTPSSAPRPTPRERTPDPFAPVERPRRSSCFREHRPPHPRRFLASRPTQLEPLGGLRPVAGDDVLQLAPFRLGVPPDASLLLGGLGIGTRHPEPPDLRP